MRKWMVECPKKSGSRGDKFSRVNSISITKSINLLSFCTGEGVLCAVDIYKLTARVYYIKLSVPVQLSIFGIFVLIFINNCCGTGNNVWKFQASTI